MLLAYLCRLLIAYVMYGADLNPQSIPDLVYFRVFHRESGGLVPFQLEIRALRATTSIIAFSFSQWASCLNVSHLSPSLRAATSKYSSSRAVTLENQLVSTHPVSFADVIYGCLTESCLATLVELIVCAIDMLLRVRGPCAHCKPCFPFMVGQC